MAAEKKLHCIICGHTLDLYLFTCRVEVYDRVLQGDLVESVDVRIHVQIVSDGLIRFHLDKTTTTYVNLPLQIFTDLKDF